MDIEIELDRSEYIKQRELYIRTHDVPVLSKAITTLGEPLAQIIYEECDEELEGYFGLSPPLHGAGEELWVSPSDLLIGKVILKPPLTSKNIQALTHQGILDIGREIEIKYWNEMELEKLQALIDQKKELEEIFQDILANKIKEVELRECALCQRRLDMLTAEFEAALIEELTKLEARLREEFEEYSRNQEERLRKEWERKLKIEVKKTVQRLTIEFLNELERQETIMKYYLTLEMKKNEIQRQYDIGLERCKCKEALQQLKHNLECRNIANMMYILCMERRKCCEEKADIERYYQGELKKLNDIIDQKDQEINRLTDEKNQKIRELKLREKCILEILKQFQKFINFALRAAPTQAEFLLSVEKMMVFELAETVLKTKFLHLIPCDKILPWQPPKATAKSSTTSGLTAKDHHDCFNEISLPRPEELGPDDFLPGFCYKDNLYVREDFRNMVSQGIKMSPSNELWNSEVDILMDLLKKSVSDVEIDDQTQESEEIQGSPSGSKRYSLQSHTLFKRRKTSKSVSLSVSLSDDVKSTDTKKKFLSERKPSCKPNSDMLRINFEEIGKVEQKPALIAAANSIDLIIKKKSVKYIPQNEQQKDEDEWTVDKEEKETDSVCTAQHSLMEKSKESFKLAANESDVADSPSPKLSSGSKRSAKDSLVMSTKDSIILRKTSLLKKSTDFSITPKDSIEVQKDSKCKLGKTPSKLVTARSSVEMLRESKMKLEQPIPCPKKQSPKTQPVPSYVPSDTCEKFIKTKDSTEVLGNLDKLSQQSKDSFTKSIRLAHVEVINVDEEEKEPSVAFSIKPVVYETGVRPLSKNISKIYKTGKKKPIKDKFLNQRQVVKIVGETNGNEHLQNTNEFTVDRIRSFIALIKDHPNLIRTFTACSR